MARPINQSASDNWKIMHDVLADSDFSMAAVNVLLRQYESFDDIVEKGAYHLSCSKGCGEKIFVEISYWLYRNGYIPEVWTADTIAKDRKSLSPIEHSMLRERFVRNLTMEQIGILHGFSKQMASDILKRANAKAARLYILGEEQNSKGEE